MLGSVKIAVTTSGEDGAATGTGYSTHPISGEIAAVIVDWHANAHANSDITVTLEADDNHPAITLYSKANAKTDISVYPHVQATDTAGAAIAGWYQHIVGSGRVKVVVGDSNALAPAVTVYVYYKD